MKKGFIKISRRLFGIKPKEPVKKKYFSKETKTQVRRIQRGRCAHCKKWERYRYCEFDHIRRKHDNSISNCQMLCFKCHDDKTRQDKIKSDLDKRKAKLDRTKKH